MDIKSRVIDILCETNSRIQDNIETNLLESGILDSFEIVNIVMELEMEFGVEIEPEDIAPDNFKTVEAIVKLIEKNLWWLTQEVYRKDG